MARGINADALRASLVREDFDERVFALMLEDERMVVD